MQKCLKWPGFSGSVTSENENKSWRKCYKRKICWKLMKDQMARSCFLLHAADWLSTPCPHHRLQTSLGRVKPRVSGLKVITRSGRWSTHQTCVNVSVSECWVLSPLTPSDSQTLAVRPRPSGQIGRSLGIRSAHEDTKDTDSGVPQQATQWFKAFYF